jgi:hypothetical protein
MVMQKLHLLVPGKPVGFTLRFGRYIGNNDEQASANHE